MAQVPASPKVSVLVVSYNTRDKLRRCLACIEPEHQVVVVDNGSTDGSPEMVNAEFPAVIFISNPDNKGFGAANNQGMEAAKADLILLLNSDCYAEPGAIAKLASVFDNERIAAVGGRLLNPDGSLQESLARPLTLGFVAREQLLIGILASFVRWPNWYTQHVASSLCTREMELKGIASVFQVMGACLMMRPVERFDERFFLYVEDTDLCLRLARHGAIVWAPEAIFTHELGSSSAGPNRWLGVARYNWGKELFFTIHRGHRAALVCFLLNRAGALLRLIMWLVAVLLSLGAVPKFRQKVDLFLRVLTAPRRERRPPPHIGE